MTDKIQVLYVDDEPELLILGKLFLENSGNFTVVTSPGAPQAITLLANQTFDIIISDYQMPEMDGIAFLKYLKSEGNPTPFILFTGKGREEVVIEALNNGADFYIQKGGDPETQFAELEHKTKQAVSLKKSKDSLVTTIGELEKITNRYEVLIALTNTGAWEYHDDTGYTWCSPEFFSMLGRDIRDYDISRIGDIDQVWTGLLHPDDRAGAKRYFENYMKNPFGMFEQYFRMQHRDGHYIWMLSRGKVLAGPDGNPGHIVVGTHTDVSDRKQIEEDLVRKNEELRVFNEEFASSREELPSMAEQIKPGRETLVEREHLLYAMAANVPGVIYRFYTTPDGRYGFDYISERSREILGLENNANTFLDCVIEGIIPENRECFINSVQQAIKTKTDWTFESGFITPQGREVWLKGMSSPTTDQGRLFFDGLILDITDRKLAEIALQESENLYRTIFDTTGAATIIIDNDTLILRANAGFASLSGFSIDELEEKKSLTEFVVPEDLEQIKKYHHARRDEPVHKVRVYEFRFINRSGEIRHCINNVSLIPGTTKTVASVVDISNRIQVETDLKIKHEKLMKSYEQLAATEEELRHTVDELIRKEQVLEHQSVTLGILNSVITSANKAESLPHLLNSILKESLRLLDFDGGGIYLVNLSSRKAELSCSHNLSPEFIGEISSLSIDTKPYDILFIQNKPIITENYASLAPVRSKKYGFQSLASIPLLSKDLVVGALNLASTRRQAISDEERQILISIGRELGGTIGRMLTEEEFRKASQNLETLFNTIDEMILVLDMQGNVLSANNAALKGLKYSSEEIMGVNIGILYRTEEDPGKTPITKDILDGKIKSSSIPVFSKDGSSIGVDTKITPGWWHSKEALIWVSRDVSLQKRTEAALNRTQEQYRRLTENAQDMIYRMSLPDGKYEYINPAAYNLTGYHPEDYYSNPGLIRTLIHPDWREYFQTEWKVLMKGEMPLVYEYQIIDRSGIVRWFYQRNILIKNENNEPVAIEGIITDITDRKQTEESLREAIKKIRLLTGLTRHDVYNKLYSINGYHALAMDESDPVIIHEYISYARQVEAQIEATISFTREYENFGIASSGWQLIFPIFESAMNEVSLEHVNVENHIPRDLEVYADPIIRKVFTTLLENSVRHGGNITWIRLYCRESDHEIILTCEDNGIGIPSDEKVYVFEHGYGKHTGLGLFLAREILSITGLSIRECGEQGKGAKFEILVPDGKYRRKSPQ